MKPYTKICRRPALDILAVLLCLSHSAAAIVVGWHDKMNIDCAGGYGDGVLLNQQGQPAPKGRGLVRLSTNGVQLNDGWQSEHVTFAQHTYDLVKTLSINSSVSLDSLLGSASVGLSFLNQQTFATTNLTFVFTKTKNFGTTLYPPLGFCSICGNFNYDVPAWQTYLQGEGLHAKITSEYGTHYVAGLQKAAFVWVAYTFNYSSASVKQQLSVTASGSSWDAASFSSFVDAFFKSTNTTVSMTCEIHSSSSRPPPSTNMIASFQQFTSLVGQIEAYANSFTEADAQTTGYVLNPIQSVPGYLFLLGGYIPTPVEQAEYDHFLQAYAALQLWQQRLAYWQNANWLNDQGRQVLTNKWNDVNNYLNAMNTTGNNHFNTGAPLQVPADVVTFLANLSDLRFPALYAVDSFHFLHYDGNCNCALNYHCLIGRVDCGSRAMAITRPFGAVVMLHKQTPTTTTTNINYDPVSFETNMLATFTSRYYGVINSHLLTLFTNEQWACFTNPASNPDLNGFFVVILRDDTSSTGDAQNWAVEITDSSSGFGNILDRMAFLDTRSGGCGSPDQTPGMVSVAVTPPPPSGSGVVGLAQLVTVQVTNASSVQVYGATLSFTLENAFDFAGASGPQGSATFNPTNRVVTYTLGPLLGGTSANIDFQLVPLQKTATVPGSSAILTLGAGLTNSAASGVSFSPIQSVAQTLGVAATPAGLQLGWSSDSTRLAVEGSLTLGAGASWSPTTNNVLQANNGNHHFLGLTAPAPQTYFRLGTQ